MPVNHESTDGEIATAYVCYESVLKARGCFFAFFQRNRLRGAGSNNWVDLQSREQPAAALRTYDEGELRRSV